MATLKKKINKVEAKVDPETKSKVLQGTVIKASMQKTVVVNVSRLVKHPKYKKYQTVSKKFKVHDENGTAKVGDKVEIIETRPISKDKHFKLVS